MQYFRSTIIYCTIPDAELVKKGPLQRHLIYITHYDMRDSNWQLCTGFPGVSLKIPHSYHSYALQKSKEKKEKSYPQHSRQHLVCNLCIVCNCEHSRMCLCTCVLRGEGQDIPQRRSQGSVEMDNSSVCQQQHTASSH